MSNFVEVLNLKTGQRGKIRRSLFEHPIFNPGILVEVDPAQKPYVEELYKSKFDPEDAPEQAEAEEHDSDKEEDN